MTLLIHPGFHKTGTSWLQQQLFSDKRYFNSLFDHPEIDALFIRPHDLEFSADNAQQAIAEKRSGAGSQIVDVISSEMLSGEIFTGARLSKIVAQRLARSCGEAKVLFTVRSQLPITRSIYLQYLKRGGRMTIDEFLNHEPEPNYGWFNSSVIQFGRLAQCYGELFGEKNILVLPQELLSRDRFLFLSYLWRFSGGENVPDGLTNDDRPREGVSPPASGMPLLRTANLFRKGPLNPNAITSLNWLGDTLHRGAYHWRIGQKASQQKTVDTIKQNYAGKFAQSNKVLQRYCPVDLGELGYEITD